MYYTKLERLQIILDIVDKLKNFKCKNNTIVNLYNENLCSFIPKFKEISNKYVKQNEENLNDFKGFLEFEEINKRIEYFFTCFKKDKPLFVIRGDINN